jgi:hypothetical protein
MRAREAKGRLCCARDSWRATLRPRRQRRQGTSDVKRPWRMQRKRVGCGGVMERTRLPCRMSGGGGSARLAAIASTARSTSKESAVFRCAAAAVIRSNASPEGVCLRVSVAPTHTAHVERHRHKVWSIFVQLKDLRRLGHHRRRGVVARTQTLGGK